MKKVFVSGCFDIIHGGHVQFFKDARALGDHLTVCFASDEVLMLAKHRKSSIPEDHKKSVIESFSFVDSVVKSSDLDPVFDFKSHIDRIKPDILAVTEDDKNVKAKKVFCLERGIKLVVLPKKVGYAPASTTSILSSIKGVRELPLRVDFAGGWLDVPRFSRKGAYIVNCTITPKVSLQSWPYQKGSGLGGSAAYAMLQAKLGVEKELDDGVGWQDPAVIEETGLCVWRSGKTPVLDFKYNPDWLVGKMLLYWTGASHIASDITRISRDFDMIERAGGLARVAVAKQSLSSLVKAVKLSYNAQIDEGMKPLPIIKGALGYKYCGAGHAGYALYIFKDDRERSKAVKGNRGEFLVIEPYINSHNL